MMSILDLLICNEFCGKDIDFSWNHPLDSDFLPLNFVSFKTIYENGYVSTQENTEL